jgi:hypothetical protein
MMNLKHAIAIVVAAATVTTVVKQSCYIVVYQHGTKRTVSHVPKACPTQQCSELRLHQTTATSETLKKDVKTWHLRLHLH